MKRVLLLGDSIRMGYQEYVKELLKDEYEVYFSEDNGRFATYTLWQANQMFKYYGHFDVVHWNNGYWDMNVEAPMTEAMLSVEDYCRCLQRIIRLCRENADHIIFATTTPVLQQGGALDVENTGGFIQYRNEWVTAYNDAAKRVMKQEGVPVNDLYELMCQDKNYYKCPDMLHLTEEGYRICARQIADLVRAVVRGKN